MEGKHHNLWGVARGVVTDVFDEFTDDGVVEIVNVFPLYVLRER